MKTTTERIAEYYFPIFIFLVVITGYWDSPIRKFISLFLPILIIMLFLAKAKYTLKTNIEVILVCTYIGVCIITSFFAYDIANSLFFSLRILVFFLLIAAMHNWMNSMRRYLLVLNYIMLSGVVLSLSIIYSRFFGDVIVELEGAVRAGGLYSNVNSAGFVLYASIVFTFLLYLEKKQNRYLALIIFFLAALIFTGSRASMLALAITILVYNLRFRLTKKILALIFFGAIGFLISVLFLKERILKTLRLERGFSARQILYDIGWDISKDYPVFGVGLGNLKEVGLSYLEDYPVGEWRKDLFREIGIQSSHNVFVETAAEIGFFGALILMLIIIAIGLKYYKGIKKSNNEKRNFKFLIWGFFVGVLVRCFFESNGIINRGWITIDIFFWIMHVIFLRRQDLEKARYR